MRWFYKVYVTSFDMVERVEQMARNVGHIPDWDLVSVSRASGGWLVSWVGKK